MNEVKLSIGDREYAVACAPGEEAHVTALGSVIDAKVRQLGDGGNTVEAQKLLFGALFLADELHEAQKAAEAGKAEHEDALRQTNLANQKTAQMQSTIASLEAELEGLQSAQQRHSAEVDDIRTELAQRREETEECRSELEKAAADVARLEQERGELTAQLDEALNASQAVPPPATGNTGSISPSLIDNPDLAPALERFADLLETCADKLEAGTRNT